MKKYILIWVEDEDVIAKVIDAVSMDDAIDTWRHEYYKWGVRLLSICRFE